MSVEGCLGEFEWEWSDDIGGAPPIPICWQGRIVSQQLNEPELQSLQERAAAFFRKVAPHIEAQSESIRQEAFRHLWLQRDIDLLSWPLEKEALDYRGPGFLAVQNALLTPEMLCSEYEISPAIYYSQDQSMIIHCGFGKYFKKGRHEIGKFWRKHKVEIIIGGAVLGLVVTLAIVNPFAAGAVAGAGGAILDNLCNGDSPDTDGYSQIPPQAKPMPAITESRPLTTQEKWDELLTSSYVKERDIKPEPTYVPPSQFGRVFPSPLPPISSPAPQVLVEPPPSKGAPLFAYTPTPPKEPPVFTAGPPPSSKETHFLNEWEAQLLQRQRKAEMMLECYREPWEAEKHFYEDMLCHKSERLPTMGAPNKHLRVLGVNGINTTKDEAASHQAYIKSMLPEHCPVDYIYNHSHGAIIDVVEAALLNHSGWAPVTAEMIRESFHEFHKNNLDNPDRKMIIPCHSQGSILVYDALAGEPPEITNRVISIAIAPAKVIPKSACYDAFNYASESDIVHYGEIMHAGFWDPSETGISPKFEMILENREELIILKNHERATGINHSFQSETFENRLRKHLEDYVERDGIYKRKDKEN